MTGIHLLAMVLAFVLVLAIFGGCAGPVRYVPMTSTDTTAQARTQECLDACEESWRDWYYTHGLGGENRSECVARCPGIVAEYGTCSQLGPDRDSRHCEDTQ